MVTFKYGTSELGKSFTSKLNQLKSFLDSSPEYSLLITGHACDLGTDEANQALSDARSESVKKYLVEQGLPANRVLVKGFGERAPMVPNNNESNRRKNRRVDFSLVNN
jgi:outer membrane protein OmpA-like peptidoglycan-associated protein